jgi:hypothetical protein
MDLSFIMPIVIVLLAVICPILAWKYFKLKRDHSKLLDDYYEQDDADYFEEEYDDNDDWEGGFWDAANPIPVQVTLDMNYVDGKGQSTKRKVDIRQFDGQLYDGIMMGHCHLRNETRTFRFDRVESAVDTGTGEIIKDIRAYMLRKFHDSPFGTLHELSENNPDEFGIFFFLAKLDNRFMPREKEAVAKYARAESGCADISKDDISGLFEDWETPSIKEFRTMLSALSKSGSLLKIEKTCIDIIGKQAAKDPMAKILLDEIHSAACVDRGVESNISTPAKE